ncbi:protein SPT2 homolog isoform X1 [Conger conger]|uniref:protein SPT2 homolog isoform X1 n=2 Tax=Conger conger TaxID=82655 RepID=UPI002A5A2381|nr:protein SPT2 homolog isoform X1 [Conger conger]
MAYYIPGTWNLDMEEIFWHATDRGYSSDAFILSKYGATFHKNGGTEENAIPDRDVSMHSEMDESPTDVMFRKKDQKDAELDKKIEALRKKNEALMKRYQEVEEDKKRAEEEGMALQGRKGKAEDLTITINKSTNETRVVTKKTGCGDAANARGVQDPAELDINPFGMGRGKRRQLLVTMAGNTKGKRIVSEKRAQNHPPSPGGMKDVTEEEDVECARRGRHLQASKPDSWPQEDELMQERQGLTEESQWLAECDPYYKDVDGPDLQSHTDLTVPTSREEQLEYLRWKKEREQIDRERVARHKNAKGQWRRAWDMDKSENMFRDRFHGESERGNKRGGRNARRGQSRSTGESQGHPYRNRDEGGKNMPAVGSKAKGKDRLTGRARRWDAKEEDDAQTMETSLEEFLEELDAFVGPEVDLSPKSREESKEEEIGKGLHTGTVGADEAGSNDAVDGDHPVGDEVAPQPGPGHGSNDTASNPGRGANDTASNPGRGANDTASDPGHGAKDAASDPGHGANNAASNPGCGANNTASDPGPGANNTASDPGCGANNSADPGSGTPAASQGEKAPIPRRSPEKKVRFSEENVKETKAPAEAAPSPVPPQPEVMGAIKGSSHVGPSPSAVTEEAKQTLASGLRGPAGEGVQKRDQEASDLPHSSAPVSSVAVVSHAAGPEPQDASETEMVEQKQDEPQGLPPEPETGQRATDGDSASLPEESAHQPLKHSKNARSPEEMINSSLSVMTLDSGAPQSYHETSNAKVKENGKIV